MIHPERANLGDQHVTLTFAFAWNDTCTWSMWLAVGLPRSSISFQPLPSL
jgi:hypothetical protein